MAKLDNIIGSSSLAQRSTAQCKLVLLCAPAGYGKTTLLADYARSTSLPCCWYFLDEADSDRIVFLTCLLASIRQRFPQFGTQIDELLEQVIAANSSIPDGWQRIETILDELVNAIHAEISERFVLVLCNYHEVNASESINRLINRLLRILPPQCVLIIESRAVPALELAGLLARREMTGLGTETLRFSSQDIQQLADIQQLPALTAVEADQLVKSFDGWIVGLLLGTRLGGEMQFLYSLCHDLKNNPAYMLTQTTGETQGIPANWRNLLQCLIDEVFKREPEAYAFLKEVALLEQMTPALCNALLDTTDASEQLQHLERQGLFVIHSGEAAQIIYKCHPILREIFCSELRRQFPERFVFLQQRAATLYRESRDYEQAFHHALQAGDDTFATNIIIEVSQDMIAQGRVETLARWIDTLSATTTILSPRLLLIRARLYLLAGELLPALPLLDSASSILEQQTTGNAESGLTENSSLQAEISLMRSRTLFRMGKYGQAQALCKQLLSLLPVDEVAQHAEAHNLLGISANLLGQFTSGITHLQQALQFWGRDTINRETAELHSILASSYGAMGNFALAEHHLSRALTCWNHLQDEWGKVYNLIRMGIVKHRQGNLNDAEALFSEALTITRGPIHFRRGEAYALANLGELYQEQERYQQALPALEESVALARQIQDTFLIHTALSTLAMTYLLMGDATTAMLILSETEPQESIAQGTGYEKLLCKLTLGTILLYQQNYQQAHTVLMEVEASLSTSGLKRELLQSQLRLAACLHIQGQTDSAMRRIEVLTPSIIRSGYEQTVLIELKRQPGLYELITTRPEHRSLRAALHMEAEAQGQPVPATQEPPALNSPPSFSAQTPPPGKSAATAGGHQHCPVQLRALALGEPSIFRGDTQITRWRMARSMELCFFLLDCNRPMHKEQIIELLWPEADEQMDQTFRSTVFYLRKTVGETYLLYQGGAYTLDRHAIWYDVNAFREYYAQAKAAMQAKEGEAARKALLSMVELYHGDYVQSFYSNWCSFRRDELKRLYLDGRRQLARIHWRLEQYDESILHWQHMLAIDSCMEEAHYGLMRCFLKQGKRSLSLRQYQRCVTSLREELGVEPGSSIQNLYQRLTESQ